MLVILDRPSLIPPPPPPLSAKRDDRALAVPAALYGRW